MQEPTVVGICICAQAGEPMVALTEVEAVAGHGLLGDRYAVGHGSFNKGRTGARQVTLMNAQFFVNSGFDFIDSRRNLFVSGVELMWLIGKKFKLGEVELKGVKYCDPCERPRNLSKKEYSFKEAFFDRGGLIAEVVTSGTITVGDTVTVPPKGY